MRLPPSQSTQAALIEKNLQTVFLAMSVAQKQCNGSQYLFSDIPHPIFNCVVEAKSADGDVQRTILSIWEDYQKQNKLHSWWISERSEPQNFAQHLQALGFQKGPVYSGMHGKLKKMDFVLERSPSIRIERMSDPEAFDAWMKPMAESFEFSPAVAAAFGKCYQNLFVTTDQWINYFAFYEDQLAGVSSLFLGKDAAGLYNGAVFPQFRNKGVLTHLGRTMLADAQSHGTEDVVVQVSGASHNISLKAGFKEYLKFQAYLSPS